VGRSAGIAGAVSDILNGETWRVETADNLLYLPGLPDDSVDAVVTDPPYGLEFMGKDWDGANGFRRALNQVDVGRENVFGRTSAKGPEYRAGRLFQAWCERWGREVFRVLKPGGHLVAFGGARTHHRLWCGLEDAGFELRDTIAAYGLQWLYGSGFPKSLDIGKALDKAVGAEREVTGAKTYADGTSARRTQRLGGHATFADPVSRESNLTVTAPATDEAKRWSGWGTALKPAVEPILCATKPLSMVSFDYALFNQLHHKLGALIWLSSADAKHVDTSSQSSPVGPQEGLCASALASAVMDTWCGSSGTTDTFRSPEAASTSLSIVSSWSAILAASLGAGNRFTTSTASGLTTGLRILNSLMSPITSAITTPPCECLLSGEPSHVRTAGATSSDDFAMWKLTLSRSVPEGAISQVALAVAPVLASIADQLSRPYPAMAGDSALRPAPTDRQAAPEESGIGYASTAASPSPPNGQPPDSARSGAPDTDNRSPAVEPILLARKPLSERNVVSNVLRHGTGGINVDACRVEGTWTTWRRSDGTINPTRGAVNTYGEFTDGRNPENPAGRWPPNAVFVHSPSCHQIGVKTVSHGSPSVAVGEGQPFNAERGWNSHSMTRGGQHAPERYGTETVADWTCADDCPVAELDRQSGDVGSFLPVGKEYPTSKNGAVYGTLTPGKTFNPGGTGGASRFFPTFRYQAKADTAERNIGLPPGERNTHPTCKPVELMQWLCRLVTPPGGIILDPFAGSGTTGMAALREDFRFLGVEQDVEHAATARLRIEGDAPLLNAPAEATPPLRPEPVPEPVGPEQGTLAL
jgi:DNA modification methylase